GMKLPHKAEVTRRQKPLKSPFVTVPLAGGVPDAGPSVTITLTFTGTGGPAALPGARPLRTGGALREKKKDIPLSFFPACRPRGTAGKVRANADHGFGKKDRGPEEAPLGSNGAAVLKVSLLGPVDFEAALALQRLLVYQVAGDRSGAALLLCEPPPVITVGREGSR